jgi:glycosyltransferase involved in cell wall biosynthesis
MNVVFLSTAGNLGGGERNLLNILAGLRQIEPAWQLRLIAGSDGPLLQEARRLGVPAEALPFPDRLAALGDAGAGGPAGNQISRLALLQNCLLATPGLAPYIFRLKRLLARSAPNLIHTSGFKMHILGSWARPRTARLVWHVEDYIGSRPFMSRLLTRHASACSAAITASRSVAADVSASCGPGLRSYPVLNGIDLDRFIPDGPVLDLDALSGLPPAAAGVVRVGLVGTFSRWKGHLVFLDALASLPPHLPIRAYIIGGSVYRTAGSQFQLEELRAHARQRGIGDRVGFTGFLNDTAAAIRSLDVVVHASTAPEPFGLVIAEAMACGKALIVAEAGGATEVARVGECALGHPPGRADVLCERIRRLASDPGLRATLGAAARLTAIRSFDRLRMAAELTAIYRQTQAPAAAYGPVDPLPTKVTE